MSDTRFGIFSDESRHTAARYRSIAAVSLPVSAYTTINSKIKFILNENRIKDFKWKKTGSTKYLKCSMNMIDIVFSDLIPNNGRVDVLIWDTQDSRHMVHGRDDLRNFERMYFHLHRNIMQRFKPETEWHLRPDERMEIDWKALHTYLQLAGNKLKYYKHPLLQDEYSKKYFRIGTMEQGRSNDLPLCQLADLFAGISAYSRDKYQIIKSQWENYIGQETLFDLPSDKISKRDQIRFQLIRKFYQECINRKAGVSLKTEGFFRTKNPINPINFWHYKPQGEYDIAPIK